MCTRCEGESFASALDSFIKDSLRCDSPTDPAEREQRIIDLVILYLTACPFECELEATEGETAKTECKNECAALGQVISNILGRPMTPDEATLIRLATDSKCNDPELIKEPQKPNGETDNEQDGNGASDDDDCNGNKAEGGGNGQLSDAPVHLVSGRKIESATDLTIRLPGEDFRFTRSYTSSVNVGSNAGMIGVRWSSNQFWFVVEQDDTPNPRPVLHTSGYKIDSAWDAVSGEWKVKGANTQVFRKAAVTIGAERYPLWELEQPGAWTVRFYRSNDAGETGEYGTGSGIDWAQWPDPRIGLMYDRTDVHGNRREFAYSNYDAAASDPGELDWLHRLESITFENAEGTPLARMEFEWVPYDSAIPFEANEGRLAAVEEIRFALVGETLEEFVTQRVDYMYVGANYVGEPFGPELSADVGSPGDLIQVSKHEYLGSTGFANDGSTDILAPVNAHIVRNRITQYRYHSGFESPAPSVAIGGSSPFALNGGVHFLKMVIAPEQIELLAVKLADGSTIQDAAEDLLRLGDNVDAGTSGISVAEWASKIITRYNDSIPAHPVEEQIILADCGCGSGGAVRGTMQQFTYITADDGTWKSTMIRESALATASTVYRTRVYDYELHGADKVPYLVTSAIVEGDAAGESRRQVWHSIYNSSTDGTARTLRMAQTPSACSADLAAFRIAVSGASTEAPSLRYAGYTDAGLVYEYAYNAENRRTETWIGKGHGYDNQAAAELGTSQVDSPVLIERVTYPGSDDRVGPVFARTHLPTKIERFRTEDGGASDERDIETSVYDYGFFYPIGSSLASDATDAIAWMRIGTERESIEENGPAAVDAVPSLASGSEDTVYESVTLLNRNGQDIASREADGSVSTRAFDEATGALVSVSRNVDASVIGAHPASGEGNSRSFSSWASTDREPDGGSLTTAYAVDLCGRVRTTTRPGSIEEHTRRQMVEDSLRASVPHYAVVSIPDETGASSGDPPYAGPVRVAWYNARDASTRSSEFALSALESGLTSEATLESALQDLLDLSEMGSLASEESARSAAVHGIDGLIESTLVWPLADAFGIVETAPFEAYETTYGYDGFGRVTRIENAVGSVQVMGYDPLDRVAYEGRGIAITPGVPSGGDTVEGVVKYIYDSTGDQSAFKSGLSTRVISYPSSESIGALVDSATSVSTGNGARETVTAYDDRDRPTRVVNPLAPHVKFEYDNLDRAIAETVFRIDGVLDKPGRITETAFSQRGLVYRERIAIDPEAATEWLASYTWFDEVGRMVGRWDASSPGVKLSYDGLGRRSAVYLTDRGGDAAPEVSGSFASVYDEASHAAVLTADKIIEQTEYRYISGSDPTDLGFGRVDLVTSWVRAHDSSITGLLEDSVDTITSYSGMFYDGSGRMTRRAEFGTNRTGYKNSGPLPDVDQESPTALPTDSDDPIVSITVYDAEGRVAESIDAEGIRTETRYDAMDRPIASIENSTGTVALSWNATDGRWEITSGAPSAEDEDRVTSFVYDGISNITHRVAHFFDGSTEDAQVTVYGYGPASSGLLQSRDVVVEINYPDASELDCGLAGTAPSRSMLYEYNWLGELTKTTDQRGFARVFARDALGRITSDAAGGVSSPSCNETSIGLSAQPFFESGAKIEYVYDEFGRLRLVRSSASCGGGGTGQRNEIWYGYDDLWQIDSMVQNPGRYTGLDATIDTTSDRTKALAKVTTQAVTLFDYDIDAAANYTRLTKITYPQSIGGSTPTELAYTYTGHGGVDDAISRPTGLSWFAKNATRTATYDLIGMDKVAAKTMQSGLTLDYFQTDASTPVGTSGSYAAYDRFGRATNIRWRTGTAVNADFEYEYSPASDILTRIDKSASGSGDRFQRYEYDGLHRLTQAIRTLPELLGTTPSETPWYAAGSEQWTLDTMGNWDRIAAKPRYDAAPAGYPKSAWPSGAPASFVDPGDYTDRAHDPQSNELAQLDVNEVGTADTRRFHDNAGNLVCVYLSESLRRIYEYDPWNRLTRVKEERNADSDPPNSPGSWTNFRTIAQHTYYGLHQRATSVYSEDYVSEDVSMSNNYPDVYMVYVYDPQWRLLETRSGTLGNDSMSDWNAFRTCSESAPLTMAANQFPAGLTGTSQYVWGLVYIDELIAFQKDGNLFAVPPVDPDGDFQDTADYLRFAIHDRNWSVVGFGGHGVDRRYTPYGDAEPRAMNGTSPFAADMLPGDFNFDGAVNAADFNIVSGNFGNPGNFLQGDANFDGIVNAADFTIMAGSFGKSWTVRTDAQLFAEATGANGCLIGYCGYVFEPLTELYHVRHRWYEPEQGRWLTRDPIRYVDGMNLFEYVKGAPAIATDPLGLMGGLGLGLRRYFLLNYDPRNDPRKGCGITVRRIRINLHTGDFGHEWIVIDDPSLTNLQGIGFWPDGNASKAKPEHPGELYSPGARNGLNCKCTQLNDPYTTNQPDIIWEVFPARKAIQTNPDSPGRPWFQYVPANNYSTCDEMRKCVRNAMVDRRYHVTKFNCRHAATAILKSCGLTRLARDQYTGPHAWTPIFYPSQPGPKY